jgi:hypothetical protein
MILKKLEIHNEQSFCEFSVAKSDGHPDRLLFVMENINDKVIYQELYKEDVEALILFLQKNMPD